MWQLGPDLLHCGCLLGETLGHVFLPESASTLIVDSTAVLVPVYLRPKFPSVIDHRSIQ